MRLRLLPLAIAGASLVVVGAGGAATARAMSRASAFHHSATALERSWTADVGEGVPASSVAPLRTTLERSKYMHASTWSPLWWMDDGSGFLTTMHSDTQRVWSAALSVARSHAEAEMTAWSQMEMQFGTYVPAAAASDAATWTTKLAAATTPAAINQLVVTWTGAVTAAHNSALLDEVKVAAGSYGGLSSLLTRAHHTVAVAQGENLPTGAVPSLIATLTSNATDPSVAVPAIKTLAADLDTVNALITLDGRVASDLRNLDTRVQLAAEHNAVGAAGFAGQYASLSALLRQGGTTAHLDSVEAQIATVESSVNAALTAVGCGHDVPNGKVIDFNLSTQSAVFYDDGCLAGSSLITSGRAGLRTPTGTYRIYRKVSPITLISPWPKSSPWYYSPEKADYAMEFRGGGFFIHDAPWEPTSVFGPGSENSVDASHGCVHIPMPTMQWLYAWTPIGATVIIHY
jgi:lipoprotein-anchoring transpeptidase ErfK/SrfK